MKFNIVFDVISFPHQSFRLSVLDKLAGANASCRLNEHLEAKFENLE